MSDLDEYHPTGLERLRVYAELAQIVVCIAIVVTLFVYPAALLRGEAHRFREVLVGYLGILCWAYAAVTFVHHWPF